MKHKLLIAALALLAVGFAQDLSVLVITNATAQTARGDSLLVQAYVSSAGEPVLDAAVTLVSPDETQLGFSQTGNGFYSLAYRTGWDAPLLLSFQVSAAKANETGTGAVTVGIKPALLSVVLGTKDFYKAGETLQISVNASYPDKTFILTARVTGLLVGVQNLTLNFSRNSEKEFLLSSLSSGSFLFPSYVVSRADEKRGELFATVEARDEYENAGTANATIFIEPYEYGLAIQRFSPQASVFAYGQTAEFSVRILDLEANPVEKAFVYAQVENFDERRILNELGSGYYGFNYRISRETLPPLRVIIRAVKNETKSVSLPLTLQLTSNLTVEFPIPANTTVENNKTLDVRILYPNGEPVQRGFFEIEAGGRKFPMAKQEGFFVGKISFGVNETEGLKTIRVVGLDEFGNSADAATTVFYSKPKPTDLWFIAILFASGLAIIIILNFIYRTKAKKHNVLAEYQNLLEERKHVETLDKQTHLDFYKRKIGEMDMHRLITEYRQRAREIGARLDRLEKRHPFLKKIKKKEKA